MALVALMMGSLALVGCEPAKEEGGTTTTDTKTGTPDNATTPDETSTKPEEGAGMTGESKEGGATTPTDGEKKDGEATPTEGGKTDEAAPKEEGH